MIQVNTVTKTYGKKNNTFQALQNVSFEIPDGASVAIIGKSGSGKSTLMHAMSGLDRPEQGQIIVNGQNILDLGQKAMDEFRSKTIGFIFQSFFVQGTETCFDNVSMPLEIAKVPRAERRAMVEQALASVELSDKIKERASNLSGGQKQRLAIARAIVTNPKIIFADEPTGNLDSVTGDLVERLLFNHSKTAGATLIIVTHDQELAAKCDMQIYIKDGKVEAIKTAAPSTAQPQQPLAAAPVVGMVQ